jgi:hypothetical protein
MAGSQARQAEAGAQPKHTKGTATMKHTYPAMPATDDASEEITVTLHCKACMQERDLTATRRFIAWMYRIDEITETDSPTADFDEWECPACYARDVIAMPVFAEATR